MQKQYSKERLRFARVKSGRLCRIHGIAGSFSQLLVLQRSPGEERCQSQVLTIPIDNYFGWKKFCSLNITIILTFPIRIENNSTVVILYFCDYSPSMFPIIFFFQHGDAATYQTGFILQPTSAVYDGRVNNEQKVDLVYFSCLMRSLFEINYN